MRSDVAGADLTELLIKPLTSKGHLLSTDQVNHIKESICFVAKDFDAELKAGKEAGATPLPLLLLLYRLSPFPQSALVIRQASPLPLPSSTTGASSRWARRW
jgi:hypothetical protein